MGKGNFFSYFRYYKIASKDYKRIVPAFLLFALFNSSDVFLLLKTKEITQDDTLTIAAYIFYNLVYAISSYPAGILADRFGFRKIFLSGLVLFAIVYSGFAFQPSIAGIFILFFIYGLYAAATEGITKAWVSNIAHESNTATAIGFYTSCESICALFASIIAGALWTYYGSLYALGLTSLMSMVIFVFLLIKTKRGKITEAVA